MEAVHSMTSIAMSASQRPGLNSHTPPWTCSREGAPGRRGGKNRHKTLSPVSPSPGALTATWAELFPTPTFLGGAGKFQRPAHLGSLPTELGEIPSLPPSVRAEKGLEEALEKGSRRSRTLISAAMGLRVGGRSSSSLAALEHAAHWPCFLPSG